jgi:predicted phosphohydrolase
MNIFSGWANHTERLTANWKRLVKENDTVILPGDFSWGLKIEETLEDFISDYVEIYEKEI